MSEYLGCFLHDFQQLYGFGRTPCEISMAFKKSCLKRGISEEQILDWFSTKELACSPTNSKIVLQNFKDGKVYDFRMEEGEIKPPLKNATKSKKRRSSKTREKKDV